MRKLSYDSKVSDPARAQTYDTVTFEVRARYTLSVILKQVHQQVTFQGPPKMEQVLWPAHCVQVQEQ